MLNDGASVNFYMFYGGTNFGFTAGANDGGDGRYQADITSYDYDAPMNEAGDPTPKYFAIRDVISRYLPLPNIPVPDAQPRKAYGSVQLLGCCSLLSKAGRALLSTGVVVSEKPKTLEQLNQYSGLVLYETFLPQTKKDPAVLRVPGLHDRAYVYVDHHFVGILAREIPIYDMPISVSAGRKLQILVESQGRINYGPTTDLKGITDTVTFDRKILTNWNMTKFPLESYEDIEKLVEQEGSKLNEIDAHHMLVHGPTIYYGTFSINDRKPCDTYMDMTGWSKGLVFVNGENMGRYWPLAGPQITLYIPAEVLKVGVNNIIVIEYQRPAASNAITLTDTPNLDGLKK